MIGYPVDCAHGCDNYRSSTPHQPGCLIDTGQDVRQRQDVKLLDLPEIVCFILPDQIRPKKDILLAIKNTANDKTVRVGKGTWVWRSPRLVK